MNHFYHFMLVSAVLVSPHCFTMEDNNDSKIVPTTAISFDLDEVTNTCATCIRTDICIEQEWNHFIKKASSVIQNAHNKDSELTRKIVPIFKRGELVFYPITPIIDLINTLKNKGYTVVAATNKTIAGYLLYAQQMQELHGIDLSNLFDAILTTLCVSSKVSPTKEALKNADRLYDHVRGTKNVYAFFYSNIGKPHPYYYQALKALIKSKAPHITKTIHIDDSFSNVDGARNIPDMDAVCFRTPQCEPNDLMLAVGVMNLKNDLKNLGIECD